MPLRVLLVEDNQQMADVLAALLEHLVEVAEVRVASSSDEAVAVLRGFVPDLMVVDLILGEWDLEAAADSLERTSGYRFIADRHYDPRTSHIPVLVITGLYLLKRMEIQLRRLAVADILVKPFTASVLLQAVISILDVPQHPDAALIRVGSESQSLDYKEVIDLTGKVGRASLAKDVIAMANWGGGNIIVGVRETAPGSFRPVGVPPELLGQYESSRLNRAIRDYLDPPVPVAVRRLEQFGGTFVILDIPPAKDRLILAAKKHELGGLYPGRIYTRTTAAESAEVQRSEELQELLERVMRDRSRSGE